MWSHLYHRMAGRHPRQDGVSAEWRRQRGSGAAMVGSAAAALGAQERWRQRIGGSGSGGGSSAAAGSGAAGGGRAVVAAAARRWHWQGGDDVSSAVAASAEAARQQCGRSEQRGDGICSTVLATGAWWQRWQSSEGSMAVALRQWAARRRRCQRESGNVAQRRRCWRQRQLSSGEQQGCRVTGWQQWQQQSGGGGGSTATTTKARR